VVVWVAGCLGAAPARAVELGVLVHVEREEDLHELHDEGLLDDASLQALLDLYRTGVDVETAGREDLYALPNLTFTEVDAIISYREGHGGVGDPEALVASGILDARKLGAIRAFLRVHADDGDPATPPRTHGHVRLMTHWIAGDRAPPPALLQARLHTARHLSMGVSAVLLRQRAGPVSYDASRHALVADGPAPRAEMPKFFVRWDPGPWAFIAGTYRAGFAQGVTFDTTGASRAEGFQPDDTVRRGGDPSGACRMSSGELAESPCAGPGRYALTTPDFGWTEGLRGVAASLRALPMGSATLALHAFLSYQTHAVYQYQLADATSCGAGDHGDCRAPPVLVRQPDPFAPAPAHAWQTFPRVHDVAVAGGRASVRLRERASVGATAYGAGVRWRVPGASLDLQDWARLPSGGPFGAVGVDGSVGRGPADLHLEATRSFDAAPGGGGGLGALARLIVAAGGGELDASARYYAARFSNPFARPVAAPDRFEGLRARDEVGGQVRYAAPIHRAHLDLRMLLDVWRRPSLGVSRLHALVRADRRFGRAMAAGVEVDVTDRDLRRTGRGQCFEGESLVEAAEAPVPCGGARHHLTARLELTPSRAVHVRARHRHTFVADARYEGRFRQDVSQWLVLRLRLHPRVRLMARLRHLWMDLSDRARLEHSLRGYAEVTARLGRATLLRLRYEHLMWLDRRESSQLRTPSPVHWIWLEIMCRLGHSARQR
jgi:hypothetical protein